tara:strand:+ start:101 stop:409 length:309 start_codon:yes stop_codon:yes gene_type:complete
MSKTYNLMEAAELLNRSTMQVSRYIESGLLSAEKIGRFWSITQEDIDNFQSPTRAAFNNVVKGKSVSAFGELLDLVKTKDWNDEEKKIIKRARQIYNEIKKQ